MDGGTRKSAHHRWTLYMELPKRPVLRPRPALSPMELPRPLCRSTRGVVPPHRCHREYTRGTEASVGRLSPSHGHARQGSVLRTRTTAITDSYYHRLWCQHRGPIPNQAGGTFGHRAIAQYQMLVLDETPANQRKRDRKRKERKIPLANHCDLVTQDSFGKAWIVWQHSMNFVSPNLLYIKSSDSDGNSHAKVFTMMRTILQPFPNTPYPPPAEQA